MAAFTIEQVQDFLEILSAGTEDSAAAAQSNENASIRSCALSFIQSSSSADIKSSSLALQALLSCDQYLSEPGKTASIALSSSPDFSKSLFSFLSQAFSSQDEDATMMSLIFLLDVLPKDQIESFSTPFQGEVLDTLLQIVAGRFENDSIARAALCCIAHIYEKTGSELLFSRLSSLDEVCKPFGDQLLQVFNRNEFHSQETFIAFLCEMLDSSSISSRLFFPNDIKVLMDIVYRELSNLSEDSELRLPFLICLKRVLVHEQYRETRGYRGKDTLALLKAISKTEGAPAFVRDLADEVIDEFEPSLRMGL